MESPVFFYTNENSQFTPEKHPKSGDNFIIEDLLDFSNQDDVLGDDGFQNSADSSNVTVVDSCNSSFSGGDPHFSGQQSFPDSNLSGDLCVPYDDIAELEWLSNFVEESFSSEDLQKLQIISGIKTEISETQDSVSPPPPPQPQQQPETNRNNPIFRRETPLPGKARSKRSRTAPCNWSSRLLALSPTPTSSSSECDFAPNFGKKTLKIHKKKEISEFGDGRKCLHCATDKTPQWRTGPLGPKTLCNACGVRYKSGRLVPEYRPAASPTFVPVKHSNSHRKVMEMRRQKEMQRSQHEQFLYPSGLYDISACGADDFLIHHRTGSDFPQLI